MRPLQPEVLAQIDFSYAFIINDFLGLARGQHGPVVDDIRAVAYAECLPDIMVRDQYPDIALPQEADDFLDVQHRDRIDPGEGFIEQDEGGLGGEGPGDLEAAALFAGQADGRAVAQVGNVQIVQQRIELGMNGLFVQIAQFEDGPDILRDRQFAKDRRFLRQVGQAKAGAPMDGRMGKSLLVEEEIATVKRYQAYHHVEAGGLARAVGPEQADDFAAGNVERDILDDSTRLIALLQFLRAQLAHRWVGRTVRQTVIVSEFVPPPKVSVPRRPARRQGLRVSVWAG